MPNKIILFLNLMLIAILIMANLAIIYTDLLTPVSKKWLLITVNLIIILLVLSMKRINIEKERGMLSLRTGYEKLRLNAETTHREIEVLYKLNDASALFMEEKISLEGVFDYISESIQRILNVDISILQLFSENNPQPTTQIFKGRGKMVLDKSIYEKVILKGSSILINFLSRSHSEYKRYRILCEQGFKSFLVAPLRTKGKVIGLLGAFTHDERSFTGEDLRVLTTFAIQATLIIENARLRELTRYLSITDEMTQISNYRHFTERLEQEFHRAQRYKHALSLLIADIDFFKNYNDTYGHPAGDSILRKTAHILKTSARPTDLLARYGGDEFVFILTETDKEGAKLFAQRTRKKIEETTFKGEETQPQGKLTITIGLSSFPLDAQSSEELIVHADEALYKGKQTGKNKVCVY